MQETFEGAVASWQVTRDTGGSGTVTASNARAAAGTFSARAATSGSGSVAQVRVAYTDAGGSHTWQERPGTYRWQRLRVYLPSTSVAQLGATEYLTIAGFWASGSGGPGWFLRVRQNGALYVTGNRDSDNARVEFQVYGTFPQDRWVDLELGLHSQAGPGIKRAFAFLVDGSFYGWYHQGRMQAETYDRVAAGILDTNSADPLEVFMDEWRVPTTTALPDGTDTRSTAALQEQDFRAQSGVSWQIDWTTWANDLRLDPTFGIFSNVDRLQSGRNLDRMPSLTSGWAEIEIDWSKGTPPLQPNGYFSAMVGFRKELNREQNIEVIPYGRGNGNVDLVLEYWTGSATMVAQWPIPLAAAASSHIPERGDIIRVRWEQVGATDLDIRVSYYDASSTTWYNDVITGVRNVSNISGVDYNDGFHTMSSITTDSQYYSIRRYRVGTLATYPTGTGNSPPRASADTATTARNTAVTVPVLTNDSDPDGNPLTVTAVTQPANGTVAINNGATVTYTPATNFCGSNSFNYTVSDGTATASSSVTVTVTCPNMAPVAVNDTATTAQGSAVSVSVLSNDSDANGDPLTIASTTQGANGTVSINATNGTVTYTPTAAFCGSADSFTYTISDGRGGTATASVAVTVTCTPPPTGGTPTTVTYQIAAGADDVTEVGGTLDASQSTVWLGNGGATAGSYTGLRFNGIAIPKGATVSAARLEVRSSASQWIGISFTMKAEASGNSAPFAATSRPSQRTLGAASVTHNTNVNWAANTWYPLEDITAVLQAVVNRTDWAAGNSLALVLNGTGGAWSRKFVNGFEGGAANAAKLVVTYTSGGTTPPPQPPPGAFRSESFLLGLASPTAMAFTPDGRMLIAERAGTIRMVSAGDFSVEPAPFLTMTNVDTRGERGLIGLTLDPAFASNGFYYVFYTAASPLRDRVSRFTAVGGGTNPATELVIWEDTVDAADVRHGGGLRFGTDGTLFIGVGDQGDTTTGANHVSQRLTSYRGKLLRINKDGTIPTTNPFYDGAGPNFDAVWALGYRNPVRVSVDAPTGFVYVNDVGGTSTTSAEEINRGVAGANFGWPICEGTCATSGMTNPLFSYPHSGRDAVIGGGIVYRGTMFPETHVGSYFYGDRGQNWVRRLTFNASNAVSENLAFEPANGSVDGPYGAPIDLAIGPDGALYYVDADGTVRRISYYFQSNQPPAITGMSVTPTQGVYPLTVTYSAAATDPENGALTYEWSFGDGASAAGNSGTYTYPGVGAYVVRLAVSDGTNRVLSSPITINVGSAPTASITSPSAGATFRAGDTVTFTGTASDDEPIDGASFAWSVYFRRDAQSTLVLGPVSGTSGGFTIPTSGQSFSGNTSYEIRLVVKDASGLSDTKSVVITPQKVNVSFATVPAGLPITLDSTSRTTPYTTDTLVNFQHALAAPAVQTVGSVTYDFVSWSDGGAASHTIAAPASATTYTATYQARSTPPPTGPTTVTYQLSNAADDVNEVGTTFSANASPFWIGNGGTTTGSVTGLRFRGITIPRGATITSAKLEMYSRQAQWISIAMTLRGEASGNSAAFSATSKPSQRTATTAVINHSSNVNWATNTWYQFDEMATIVQEIVSRSDWASGNSLSVVVTGTGSAYSRKFIRSYEEGAATAVRLIVTYQ